MRRYSLGSFRLPNPYPTMSPKKVLIIGINYSPELTGIGKYTGEFGASLVGYGHPVDVVTTYPWYPQWKVGHGSERYRFRIEEVAGAKVIRCPIYVPSLPTPFRRILQDLSFLLTSFIAVTALLLRGRKYDIVYTAMPSLLSGFVACWYRFWHRKASLVMHIMDHQVDAAEALGMIRARWLLVLLKKSEAYLLGKADVVSTISKGMFHRLQSKPVSFRKLLILPNWVDMDCIHPRIPDRKILRDLGIPTDRKIVFYSGAIGEKQGVDALLEVSRQASSALPMLHFVVSGSGPYCEALMRQASSQGLDNLQFIPLQPVEAYNQMLNHAWLHLVIQRDTRSELFLPSKLANIWAAGGLALVTAEPGSHLFQLVLELRAGLIVPDCGAERLFDAITLLHREPEQGKSLQSNALAYVQQNLDRSKVISKYLLESGLFDADIQSVTVLSPAGMQQGRMRIRKLTGKRA